MEAHKRLYDYILCDSANERDFAVELDTSKDFAACVKLPRGAYLFQRLSANITPIGRLRSVKYNSAMIIFRPVSRICAVLKKEG